jgi:D-alanyl-lipoteichoic acid acyltransferase DltB (MBOAT superfamily)
MQFNSWIFLGVFLPIVLTGYFLLNKMRTAKVANWFLIVSNLFFYGYANWMYLIVFAVCIMANLFVGKLLCAKRKKWILILGIIFNLGILGVFKYCNFFK